MYFFFILSLKARMKIFTIVVYSKKEKKRSLSQCKISPFSLLDFSSCRIFTHNSSQTWVTSVKSDKKCDVLKYIPLEIHISL